MDVQFFFFKMTSTLTILAHVINASKW